MSKIRKTQNYNWQSPFTYEKRFMSERDRKEYFRLKSSAETITRAGILKDDPDSYFKLEDIPPVLDGLANLVNKYRKKEEKDVKPLSMDTYYLQVARNYMISLIRLFEETSGERYFSENAKDFVFPLN